MKLCEAGVGGGGMTNGPSSIFDLASKRERKGLKELSRGEK